MNNKIKCRNCGAENNFYRLTCSNCSAFLREKIFNIDLWEVILLLIESPMKAFARIIHAEHKNFIIFILFFAAVKFSIDSVYLSLALTGNNHYLSSIFLVFFISFGILLLSILLISISFTLILKSHNIKTRVRDNISIMIYSLFPHIMALVILFPIELILFGYTVFSVNPSPFVIKETLAYTMLVFELMFVLWAMFLSFMAFRRQSADYSITIIFTLIFNIAVYGLIYI